MIDPFLTARLLLATHEAASHPPAPPAPVEPLSADDTARILRLYPSFAADLAECEKRQHEPPDKTPHP